MNKKTDIFISYRRDGGDMTAMYIYQALKDRGYDAFYDVEVLRSGKFNEELLTYIRSCRDFIVILSPHALDRCVNENDWVRQEIAEAIKANKNIIPVMMNGFTFPKELPADIDSVRFHTGMTVSSEYFQESIKRLCDKFLTAKPKNRKRLMPVLGIVFAAILGAAVLVNASGKRPDMEPAPAAVNVSEMPSEAFVENADEETADTETEIPEEENISEEIGEKDVMHGDYPVLSSSIEENELPEEYETDPDGDSAGPASGWSVMGNEQYSRDMVRSVTFLPSLENVPAEAWDVSEAMDGRIMAWLEDGALFIAGDGGVKISDAPFMSQLFAGYCNAESIAFNGCVDLSEREDLSYLFWGCRRLETIDFSGVSTKSARYMTGMFSGCGALQALDLTFMDTSRVKDMSGMFLDCTGLEALNLENFDTSKVRTMESMFFNCRELKELDTSCFDTSRVETMGAMFCGCQKLERLDVSGWNTSEVVDFSETFSGCQSLENLDISGFDTGKAKYMDGMFENAWHLRTIDVKNFDTENVTTMSGMFFQCRWLEEVDVSGWNTASVEDMSYMFFDCDSLYKLDLTSFDTSRVENMAAMFQDCDGLKEVLLTGWDVENVRDMREMFMSCDQLESIGRDAESFGRGDTADMYLDCGRLFA